MAPRKSNVVAPSPSAPLRIPKTTRPSIKKEAAIKKTQVGDKVAGSAEPYAHQYNKRSTRSRRGDQAFADSNSGTLEDQMKAIASASAISAASSSNTPTLLSQSTLADEVGVVASYLSSSGDLDAANAATSSSGVGRPPTAAAKAAQSRRLKKGKKTNQVYKAPARQTAGKRVKSVDTRAAVTEASSSANTSAGNDFTINSSDLSAQASSRTMDAQASSPTADIASSEITRSLPTSTSTLNSAATRVSANVEAIAKSAKHLSPVTSLPVDAAETTNSGDVSARSSAAAQAKPAPPVVAEPTRTTRSRAVKRRRADESHVSTHHPTSRRFTSSEGKDTWGGYNAPSFKKLKPKTVVKKPLTSREAEAGRKVFNERTGMWEDLYSTGRAQAAVLFEDPHAVETSEQEVARVGETLSALCEDDLRKDALWETRNRTEDAPHGRLDPDSMHVSQAERNQAVADFSAADSDDDTEMLERLMGPTLRHLGYLHADQRLPSAKDFRGERTGAK